MEDFEAKFLKPLQSASYPAALAALSLSATVVTNIATPSPVYLKLGLLLAATSFLLSAYSIFFYRVYPSKRGLWIAASVLYLLGLSCLIISVVTLLVFTIRAVIV